MNKDPVVRSPITGKYQTQIPVEAEVQTDPPAKPTATWEAPAESAAFAAGSVPRSGIASSANVANFITISF
jgi:hypothetical protein